MSPRIEPSEYMVDADAFWHAGPDGSPVRRDLDATLEHAERVLREQGLDETGITVWLNEIIEQEAVEIAGTARIAGDPDPRTQLAKAVTWMSDRRKAIDLDTWAACEKLDSDAMLSSMLGPIRDHMDHAWPRQLVSWVEDDYADVVGEWASYEAAEPPSLRDRITEIWNTESKGTDDERHAMVEQQLIQRAREIVSNRAAADSRIDSLIGQADLRDATGAPASEGDELRETAISALADAEINFDAERAELVTVLGDLHQQGAGLSSQVWSSLQGLDEDGYVTNQIGPLDQLAQRADHRAQLNRLGQARIDFSKGVRPEARALRLDADQEPIAEQQAQPAQLAPDAPRTEPASERPDTQTGRSRVLQQVPMSHPSTQHSLEL